MKSQRDVYVSVFRGYIALFYVTAALTAVFPGSVLVYKGYKGYIKHQSRTRAGYEWARAVIMR